MAQNSLNLNFNLRNPKAQKETPINLIIRYNNQQFPYPTSEKIHPKHWQADKSKKGYQRVKQGQGLNDFSELNARLDKIEMVANDIFRRYKNDHNNETPNWQTFKLILDTNLKRVDRPSNNFLCFIKTFIANSEKRTNLKNGKKISLATIKKYRTVFNHLEDFSNTKKVTLNFEDIKLDFYDDYKAFLSDKYNLAVNSIGKDITVLKTFLNDALDKGLHSNTVFKSSKFVSISEKSDSIFLTNEELKLLSEYDLSDNPTYEKVRDLFLIGSYTGLRFSDWSSLSSLNIINDRLEVDTYKTGERVIIPLHPIVKRIFEKYGYNLPKAFSNQKTNEYIKEIAKEIEPLKITVIKKITKGGVRQTLSLKKFQLITTHTARRSFATNLFLEKFPPIAIMKITGHRTESAFMRYIKITDDSNAAALDAHWKQTA